MDIFVVHSGCDKDAVGSVIRVIEKRTPKANILVLSNGGSLWKLEAKKLLKKAQMVLFVVGKSSYRSKNIDWELKNAIKLNKVVICYKLNADNRVNACLTGKDRFSGKDRFLAETAASADEIISRIRKYETGDYDVFNSDIDKINRGELMEQYKIFLETSETLVARRQTVNSFYISANTALVAAMSALISVFEKMDARFLISMIICAVGIILCVSWSRLLTAYGILNGSKMKVISIIENQLPAALYDAEWRVMSDRLNKNSYVSFTDGERRVPKAFLVLYSISAAVAILMRLGVLNLL